MMFVTDFVTKFTDCDVDGDVEEVLHNKVFNYLTTMEGIKEDEESLIRRGVYKGNS